MNSAREWILYAAATTRAIVAGVIFVIYLLCAALPSQAQTQTATRKYKVVNLGLLDPNDPNSWPFPLAISNSGVIVGQAYLNATGLTYAVKWENGHLYKLGALPASPANAAYSSANGINDYGVAVGESNVSSNARHAVIYDKGKVIDLGVLGPLKGNVSSAAGINDFGQVLGNFTFPSHSASGYTSQPFLYQNGKIRSLGAPIPNGNSSAFAINQWGLIVGQADFANGQYAFAYLGGNI